MEFKNVSFGYSGENGRKDLVLEGISFMAELGQTIGIIGSTEAERPPSQLIRDSMM